jgi:hypothetical protein
MQTLSGSRPQDETLGMRLERARLLARERRLVHVVARLQERVTAAETAHLKRRGIARAAADFAAELEIVRRRLRLLGGPTPD